MPTYDYECFNCQETFEIFQSMQEASLQECPSCKGRVKKLIGGGAGIIFKGTGFYVTDSQKKEPSTKKPTSQE